MTNLTDVLPNYLITSVRTNLINEYIEHGTHRINTLSVDIGGTETITSARAGVFTGLSIGSLSGLLKATSGVVSAAILGTDYIKDLSGFTTDNLTEGSTNKYDVPITLTEGSNISISGTYPSFTINSSYVNTDEKVKIDSEDLVAGYLNDKLVAGTGISVTKGTGDGEGTLIVANTDKGSDVDLSGYQLTSAKGQNNGYASLDSGGKIPANELPSTVMDFKGNWDADTNTPTLIDGTGNAGDVYLVSVAGTQNLGSGDITFALGDWVLYNGSIWQKSINSNAVVSVNGQQGVVSLTSDNISEGATNKYDKTVSFIGGTNVTISGTYPDFTITDNSINSSALSSYVPYTGATTNVDLGANNLTAGSLDVIDKTQNTGINIGTFSGYDADVSFLETTNIGDNVAFGTANNFGFNVGYDGGDNVFYIKSGNQTTVNTRLAILRDTGNVGIGTIAPAEKLDVVGNLKVSGIITAGTANVDSYNLYAQGRGLRLKGVGDGFSRIVADNEPYQTTPMTIMNAVSRDSTSRSEVHFGGGTSVGYAATQLGFFTAENRTTTTGTERMRITSAGSVGIGTTTPGSKLHVGAGNIQLDDFYKTLYGNAKDATIYYDSTNLIINPQEVGSGATIFSAGNVGIGTNTPQTLLQVGGTTGSNFITLSGAITGASYGIDWAFNTPGTNKYSQVMMDYDTRATRGLQINSAYLTSFNTIDSIGAFVRNTMTILSNGNVGIGTTAPSSKLHIYEPTNASAILKLESEKTATGGASVAEIQFVNFAGTETFTLKQDVISGDVYFGTNGGSTKMTLKYAGGLGLSTTAPSSTNGGLDIASGGLGLIIGAEDVATTRTNSTVKNSRIGSYHYTNTEEPMAVLLGQSTATENTLNWGGGTGYLNTATKHVFYTAANTTTTTGTERMRIDSSGKVGIGTSTPATLLEITGVVSSPAYGSLRLVDTSPLAADTGGAISFSGIYTGTTPVTSWAKIGGLKETATNGEYGGYLAFSTRPHGGAVTERMRISSTGNVGIGTTAPDFNLDIQGTTANILNIQRNSDAAFGPHITLKHNTASPAINDRIGYFDFYAKDSVGNDELYGYLSVDILDPTSTSEDAEFQFHPVVAGSYTNSRLSIGKDIKIPLDNVKLYFGTGDDFYTEFDGTNQNAVLSSGSFILNKNSSAVTAPFGIPTMSLIDGTSNITGLLMSNTSTGEAAESRFYMVDSTGHYVAFTQPNSTHTGTLFGLNRKDADFLFNSGGTQRDFVFGSMNAKDLHFGTSGIIRATIKGTGDVGIGTTTPDVKLSVDGTISSGGSVLGVFQLRNAAGALRGILQNTGSSIDLITTNVAPLIFSVDSSERMRITHNGNVGIGDTNPTSAKLVVNGSVNIGDGTVNTRIANDTIASYIGTTTAHPMILRTNSTQRIRLQSDGKTILKSGVPAIEYHRLADETTNYDKLSIYNSSATWNIHGSTGGTAGVSNMSIGVNAIAGGLPNRLLNIKSGMPMFSYNIGSTSINGAVMLVGEPTLGDGTFRLVSSNGVQTSLKIAPQIDQTGTASYCGLEIDIDEDTTGSGTNYLIDGKINGTKKFCVDTAGNVRTPIDNAKHYFGADDDEYLEYDPTLDGIQTAGKFKASEVRAIHKAVDGTAPVADGTYTFYNDGVTSGQVTSMTIKDGVVTALGQIP